MSGVVLLDLLVSQVVLLHLMVSVVLLVHFVVMKVVLLGVVVSWGVTVTLQVMKLVLGCLLLLVSPVMD